jgi:anthranilate phosphoribosyltransferase
MAEGMKWLAKTVDRLISGRGLSRQEARQAGLMILNNDVEEMQQGAFLAAVTAKGPSPGELAGLWDAVMEADTVVMPETDGLNIVENCGTGMDGFKTFNISTAAAITAAACRARLARHGSRGVTSACGTVDVCEALGVDVECEAELVARSVEQAGIGLFNGMSPKVHPRGLSRILSKTGFGSILNISASLANPMKPGLAVRGVYAREMILPVARTMRSIGYHHAMVMHGESGNGAGGMDELSPLGRTWLAELLPDGTILEYRVQASDFGIVPQDAGLLAGGGSPGEEALKVLDVLSGRDQGMRLHTVGLNAAPVLCVAGLARDLGQGYEKALEAIRSGASLEKLQTWVVHQNREPSTGVKKLARLLEARDAS